MFVTAALTAGLLGWHLGRAHADGAPVAAGLTFAGTIQRGDAPVNGPVDLVLRVTNAADGNGVARCQAAAPATMVTAGRFAVNLGADCTALVQREPNLWIETLIGRADGALTRLSAPTQIRAVPYAIEAQRASEAAGALRAQIASLQSTRTEAAWHMETLTSITVNIPRSTFGGELHTSLLTVSATGFNIELVGTWLIQAGQTNTLTCVLPLVPIRDYGVGTLAVSQAMDHPTPDAGCTGYIAGLSDEQAGVSVAFSGMTTTTGWRWRYVIQRLD